MVTIEIQLFERLLPMLIPFTIISLTIISFIGALVSDENCWGFVGFIVKQFKERLR